MSTKRKTDAAPRVSYAPGPGTPLGIVEMPTLQVPCFGMCTWSVVREGPGMAAVSRLRHASLMCAHYRDHVRAAEQSRLALAGGVS
jgi:hypothetical protein